VLSQATKVAVNERVHRVTQSSDRWRAIDQLRTDFGDGIDFAEGLALLGGEPALGPAGVGARLAASFTGPFRQGRFSDGSYGVLYTARKHLTANKEYAHWTPHSYNPPADRPYKVRLQLVSCVVQGPGKDVRRLLPRFPWLIDDDYTQCRALGLAAKAEGLYCLIAPSARDRQGGVTVPVFDIAAVSDGQQEGSVLFTIYAGRPTTYRTTFA